MIITALALLAFSFVDAACYATSRHESFFVGWWLPGSGIYAIIKWGRRK